MSNMSEIFLSEEMETRPDTPTHNNVTGTKFIAPDGTPKLAMDVKLLDETDDNSDIDSNIRDIKMLMKCLVESQTKFHNDILTHLQLITDEEKI